MSTLAVQVIGAINVIPKDAYKGCNSFCIVKFFGAEIFRTELCESTTDPIWQHAETKPMSVFRTKEKDHNRSCFLERLDIEVHNIDNNNKASLVSVTKIHLFNTGSPAWFSLYDPLEPKQELRSRILVGLTLLEDDGSPDGRILNFMKLADVLPFIENHHLYIDFNWAAHGAIGAPLLPAFETGEVVMDKRDHVHWDIAMGSNVFGDRHQMSCKGSLILTDIRVIFVPTEATYPSWLGLSFGGSSGKNDGSQDAPYTEEQRLLIRRLTYIMPISCLQDVKVGANGSSDVGAGVSIAFFGKDGSAVEFVVTKHPPSKMTSYQLYRAGLRTDEVLPSVWCHRVSGEISWLLKEGRTWVKFAKLLRQECEAKLSNNNLNYMSTSEVTQIVDIAGDYRRLRAAEDWDWEPSTLNGQYKLCSTYPQSLYFPKNLSDEEVTLAAKARSRNRLAVLSWVHPETGIPLTRSAQPKTGIASNSEDDRRLLLALAQSMSSAPTTRQLRIIDARPFINAQANALRGKGYENINFLGGPNVAALAFMDIHNIHVMRDSINRLREECSISNIAASANSAGYITTSSSNSSSAASEKASAHIEKTFGPGGSIGDKLEGLQQSKWLHHVSTVMRAAVTTADSIMLGHPVLVHCSDGWDRTAQLTSLTAIMLDPFYRTIEGLFIVIEKEFVSFGHQFEHRCGRTTHKETSPVFLQFLDCLYQLVTQFPTKFEYSTRMLTLFANLCYSGLFVSFNKNCEKDVMKTMSQYCTDDVLDKEDLPYTSVYTFVRVLLYSSVGESLINAFYQPSGLQLASVDYIRPKYGVSDMLLWEDGVSPGVVTGLSHFHTNTPSAEECAVFMAGSNSRYLHYLQAHVRELPESVIQTLEYIQSSHQRTLCPSSSYRRGHQQTRHDFRNFGANRLTDTSANTFLKASASPLINSNASSNETIRERLMHSAASKIQLWSRSIILASKFCIVKNEYFYADDNVIKELYNIGMDDMISKPSKPVQQVLQIFILSELKHLAKRKHHKYLVTYKLVETVVEDIVEESLSACLRVTLTDIRDSVARKSRVSADNQSGRLSDQSNTGGRLSAFTRTIAGGFGFLGGKKVEAMLDFSDDEGDSNESDGDGEDAGIGALKYAAAKTDNENVVGKDGHRDSGEGGSFASRMFKFR